MGTKLLTNLWRTKQMKTTEKLNKIYKQYKDNFQNVLPQSLHNALWQIMVNNAYAGKLKCFYATPHKKDTCLCLVVANEKGFIPVAYFKKELTLNDCEKFAYEIGLKVFGVDEKAADDIIFSSMHFKS